MKELIVSTCEKNFIRQAVSQGKRLDGRKFDDLRKLDIKYGLEWGSCVTTLGSTKVVAQVSCDVQVPKTSRPNEGLLFINVELSGMASVHFESGKINDAEVKINRILEKCFRESKCIDLEALCIVAEEKVWNVRVDLNILNYEGNVVGCCSIAALAALAHFRHPDVTSTGEGIIIHSEAERDAIPLTIHHYPVAVSFALFDQGKHIIHDPTALEEHVSDVQLVVCVNSYRELCGLYLEGSSIKTVDLVVRCSSQAAKIAKRLVDYVRDTLQEDQNVRNSNMQVPGLVSCVNEDSLFALSQERLIIKLTDRELQEKIKELTTETEEKLDVEMKDCSNEDMKIVSTGPSSAELVSNLDVKVGLGDKNAWMVDEGGDYSSESENSEVELVQEVSRHEKVIQLELSGDSEEEEVTVLKPENLEQRDLSQKLPKKKKSGKK
ncbi:unnamed protein product [Bemisia tabaci]|uniref:Exosome complex component RRP45 n=1 Tax=Bemisia tabaci TaxID=7038 RepID=A0A9P0AGQ9_BEMTA|nr:PREDICTED: exosome complex component RRP45 [Bemisia tabaci]CAH0390183.1 unnamed protein product [Bemisia tabaci]